MFSPSRALSALGGLRARSKAPVSSNCQCLGGAYGGLIRVFVSGNPLTFWRLRGRASGLFLPLRNEHSDRGEVRPPTYKAISLRAENFCPVFLERKQTPVYVSVSPFARFHQKSASPPSPMPINE